MNKIRNPKSKKSKAFTLVEILTVVFLGSVLIMAAYAVYLISYKSYKKNFESAELTQNARIALERLSREIRQANEILTELPKSPSEGTPPSEIKFQDGHNISKIQYIHYYLSGTDLYRRVSHYCLLASCDEDEWVPWSTQDAVEYFEPEEIKAQKISALQFWGNNTITIHLSVSDGTSTYTFETKTLTRNLQ